MEKVQFVIEDYSNLLAYLSQNLSDSIVFWKEEDVNNQILQWCILQSKSDKGNNETTSDTDQTEPSGGEYPVDEYNNNDEGGNFDDELTDSPEFTTIEITPISMGKTHTTIEAATELINEKELNVEHAKDILKRLCKEYPVVCSAVMKILNEE